MIFLYLIGLSAPVILSIITFLKTDAKWAPLTNWIFLISTILTVIGITFGFFGTATTLLLLPIVTPYIGVPNTQIILGIGIFATWTSLYPLAKILSMKVGDMRVQSAAENALYTMVYFYGLRIILSAFGLYFFVR